jgi:hypothetical protein
MSSSAASRSWIVVALLALGIASPARAQLSEVGVRLHSGLAMPFGDFGGFYDPGIAVGVDLAYPLRERIDVVLDLGLHYLNSQSGTYVPDTHLWRYQVGLEGDLLGDATSRIRVRPFGGVGAVRFRTKDFQIEGATPADRSTWTNKERRNYPGPLFRIAKTYLSGTGGLRLALDAGDSVTWWLSGQADWTSVGESAVDLLQKVPLADELGSFGAATSTAITLGISIRHPR